MLFRVFYIEILHITVYKLHLKYNFLRFRGGSLLLSVFYICILHNTPYKLHLKYNFLRFRGGSLLLSAFYIQTVYPYSIQITFEIQFPPFLFMPVRACSSMPAAADLACL